MGRAAPAVRILDPLPANDPQAFWYGAVVPLHVEVDGAHPLWVTAADRRIRLALNGEEFAVPAEDWVDRGQGLTLTTSLKGLRLGINTIEVSAATPRGLNRLTRAFLVDTAPRRGGTVTVDPRQVDPDVPRHRRPARPAGAACPFHRRRRRLRGLGGVRPGR